MAKHNGILGPQKPYKGYAWINISASEGPDVNRSLTILVLAVSLTASTAGVLHLLQSQAARGRRSLVVSTTTSLFDTGILDKVEEAFEAEHRIDLCFISAGTGLAIQHARRGDADMILVHAPPQERAFLEEGYGVCRKIIAYNFFAIVGPRDDPAGIEGMTPVEGLTRLVERGRADGAVWVSRGDDSGTHSKEKELWAAAGYDWGALRDEGWYREGGAGMGKTLQIAEELQAYTLTDMGTYMKYSKEALVTLEVLVGEGEELINVYSAIAVNPATNPDTNFEDAVAFIKFLVSDEGQAIFSDYGVDTYGVGLFLPAVELLKKRTDPDIVDWIEVSAYIEGSECPPAYRADQEELYG